MYVSRDSIYHVTKASISNTNQSSYVPTMSQDVFADLFASKKQNSSNLPLAQRQKLGSNVQNNSWAGLELLGSSGLSSSVPPKSASNDDIGDLLGLSPMVPKKAAESHSQSSTPQPQPQLQSRPESQTQQQAHQNFDSLFAVFDAPKKSQSTQSYADKTEKRAPQKRRESPRERPQRPARSQRFTDEDTDTYTDSHTDRHQNALEDKDVHRLFDGIGGPPENINQVVNELGNEIMQSASQIFSKGKSVLEKYQAQRKAEVSGKPAWMYQTDKYRRKGNWKSEADDGDAGEFDSTILKPYKLARDSFSDESRGNSGRGSSRSSRSNSPRPQTPERTAEKPKPTSRQSSVDSSVPRPASRQQKPAVPPSRTPKPEPTQTLVNLFGDMELDAASQSNGGTSIDPKTMQKVSQYRTLATNFFKEGNFNSALVNYKDAVDLLPDGNGTQIIMCSNLAATYAKVGDTKMCLQSCDKGLQSIKAGKWAFDDDLESGKKVKDIWVKLVTRKAETFEHLEKYSEALESWKLVLENGGASKVSIDGKRRCLEALEPKKKKAPKPVSKPSTRSSQQSSNGAVQKIKAENAKEKQLEQEKFQLYDVTQNRLNTWKHGKEDNLRALLASLQEILGPEFNWKTVGLTDLVLTKKVKIHYMKAVSKTHPDKISKSCSLEQQMIAQGVFVTLNKAWDVFKEQNNIQ